MADQWSGGQNGAGERWAVNLPAVIGVVFVFLVGVIVWVVASSGDGDDSVATGSSPSTTSFPPVSSAETTTPLPMPSTTLVPPSAAPAVVATAPATLPPTVAPVATVPPTAAPTPAPTAAPPPPPPPPPTTQAPATVAPTTLAPTTTTTTTPGTPSSAADLGVPGHPMMHPPCDGGYITVLGSAIGSEATAASMQAVLDRYSGSNYLRTDVTCSSLTPSSNGQPIYVVYFGPFATDIEACAKRTDGPKDAYVRKLSNDVGPDYSVKCK